MIFYNYESFFGKAKKKRDDDEKDVKPMGPAGVEFDTKKWQWHMMVEKLCEKLNLKPSEVYDMNYIDALNWLSMWVMKEAYIREISK